MKNLLVILVTVFAINAAQAQQQVVPAQTPSLTAQGDMTATGATDTSMHAGTTAWKASQNPLVTGTLTTNHTAKPADSVQEKVVSEVNHLGLQVDITQTVHNATGADSTTVTIYGSKTGGNWQYPYGGWVQLQQTTLSNVTTLQSINYDVNSSGPGGNPFTHYMVVVKVGELYTGTSCTWKSYLLWR